MDTEAVRRFAADLPFAADPDCIFENASRQLQGATEDEALHILSAQSRKLALAAGAGSQYTVAEAVEAQYAAYAVMFARQLIEEYHCKTPSEIAVAEMAAIAHAQHLEYSRLAKVYPRDAVIAKKVERAFRQFMAALAMLRQMKAPPLSVQVIAKNAFVAQNQVNAVQG